MSNSTLANEILKKFFGYEHFRPMQKEVVASIMDGNDTLVLMPTGGGKSICYQVPAIAKEGMGIVVSPLIALMQDQVEALLANGVNAAFMNSTQSYDQQLVLEQSIKRGEVKLLYVSPEKLLTPQFMSFLQSLPINLFAIDEAHCISQWGHDFRPEYTQMSRLKELFPQVPVIALTATADKTTRRDIVHQLNITHAQEYIDSFDRPNLSLRVEAGQKRIEKIIHFIKQRPQQSGIIYCLSRKSTEKVASRLRKEGFKAAHYHAGMGASERAKIQKDFIKDNTPIICATIAFGMGIDKPNVRWVIHYNMPKNLEGYYQEIGRAGRDGLPSNTLLFYTFADVMLLRDMVDDSGQKQLQLSKLERMQQYAESRTCRRRILLSYFGESLDKDCGNCDVCANPPEYFDGTIIAQMAMSAIIRIEKEKNAHVATGMLIDVLRGSSRVDLRQKEFDEIKTYGVGREFSYQDWQLYLQQMLNLGLIEIAYDHGNILRVTESGIKVLMGQSKVQFTKLHDFRETPSSMKKAKPKSKEEELQEALFTELRALRKELADQQGVPPYVVFGDATLVEMSKKRPISIEEMMNVSGVGEKKLRQYGNAFIGTIVRFIIRKTKEGYKIKGSTQLITFEMYQTGASVTEIARQRKLSDRAIYGHLAHMYRMGYDFDIFKFVTLEEVEQVNAAIQATGETELMKPIYEHLKGVVDYPVIGFVLAHYHRQKIVV